MMKTAYSRLMEQKVKNRNVCILRFFFFFRWVYSFRYISWKKIWFFSQVTFFLTTTQPPPLNSFRTSILLNNQNEVFFLPRDLDWNKMQACYYQNTLFDWLTNACPSHFPPVKEQPVFPSINKISTRMLTWLFPRFCYCSENQLYCQTNTLVCWRRLILRTHKIDCV